MSISRRSLAASRPGARLLIFSDGVFEIFRDGRAASGIWMLALPIWRPSANRREVVIDKLLDHVHLLRGSPQLDDDFSVIEARFD